MNSSKPTVKTLQWVHEADKDGSPIATRLRSTCGDYLIVDYGPDGYGWKRVGGKMEVDLVDLSSALAAAQRDFEARILTGLEGPHVQLDVANGLIASTLRGAIEQLSEFANSHRGVPSTQWQRATISELAHAIGLIRNQVPEADMGPLGARDIAAFKAGVDITCHVVHQNLIEGSRAWAEGGTHAVLRDRWEADAAAALNEFISEGARSEKEVTSA